MDDLSFNSPLSRILVIIYQADGMSAFTIKCMAALAGIVANSCEQPQEFV